MLNINSTRSQSTFIAAYSSTRLDAGQGRPGISPYALSISGLASVRDLSAVSRMGPAGSPPRDIDDEVPIRLNSTLLPRNCLTKGGGYPVGRDDQGGPASGIIGRGIATRESATHTSEYATQETAKKLKIYL